MNRISEFANTLINECCIGQKRYINRGKIAKDLTEKLNEFEEGINNCYGSEEITRDNDDLMDDIISNWVPQFSSILLVIEPRYVGDGRDQIDPSNVEIDIEFSLVNFLLNKEE